MSKNVISIYDKKIKKEQESNAKMSDTIIDVYIPRTDIPFWKKVNDYITKNANLFVSDEKNKEANEFFSAFSTDMDMYDEFGETLEKFRFLFSFFEVFALHNRLLNMNSNSPNSDELSYYLGYFQEILNRNKKLVLLLNKELLN